jgi:hypothetical protein
VAERESFKVYRKRKGHQKAEGSLKSAGGGIWTPDQVEMSPAQLSLFIFFILSIIV